MFVARALELAEVA